MNKYIALLLLLLGSSYAMDKPQKKYDQQATNKLKLILKEILNAPNELGTVSSAFKEKWADLQNLILIGADPNAVPQEDGYGSLSVLMWAVRYNLTEEARFLLDHGAEPDLAVKGWSALGIAASCNARESVELLLARKADPNLETTEAPLYTAAYRSGFSIVESLIKAGADVNKCNDNSLSALLAVYGPDRYKKVELLLKNNAVVSIKSTLGLNALMNIANAPSHEDDFKIAEILLEYGISLTDKDTDGKSALLLAANTSKTHIVKLLLAHNDNPNTAANNGKTSLMIGAWHGSVGVVQTLLNYGADQSMADSEGKRAIDIARERGKNEIIPLLLMHKIQ